MLSPLFYPHMNKNPFWNPNLKKKFGQGFPVPSLTRSVWGHKPINTAKSKTYLMWIIKHFNIVNFNIYNAFNPVYPQNA